MEYAFFVVIVLFVWVFAAFMRACIKLSALQRHYDNTVKCFWAKNEEHAKLKVRANDLEKVLTEMVQIFPDYPGSDWYRRASKTLGRSLSDPAQRVFPLHDEYTQDEVNVARKLAKDTLPDLPPGVDTAAQVPPRCRHCGRFKENHDKSTKALDCLPTLMPDGTLVEKQTHYEPLPPLTQPEGTKRHIPTQEFKPRVVSVQGVAGMELVEVFTCPACQRPIASCRCPIP